MEILLLCDYRPDNAATVCDHIQALRSLPGHRVKVLSNLGSLPSRLNLNRFDAVIIHYSLILSNNEYVSASARQRLRRFAGVKAIFIQDEYRWVNLAIAAMNEVGIDLLFTCVPEGEWAKVYPPEVLPGVRKIPTLTGYVPEALLKLEPLSYWERSIDVGYRTRKLGAFYGQLAREKAQIGDIFRSQAPSFGLNCDISVLETDRLYGSRWVDFMRRCRAVLGAESGASVFDFSGQIRIQVTQFERDHPEVGFEEVRRRFFPDQDGLIKVNQISPRCFEAAALRTLMILYEGSYSGILQPWRHYVPLKKDHSNMAEVVASLRDPSQWHTIVSRAYQEVACDPRWGYSSLSRSVAQTLEQALTLKAVRPAVAYADWEFWLCTVFRRLRNHCFGGLRDFLRTRLPFIYAPLRRIWHRGHAGRP
jgi:hypothetical protein